MNTHLVDIPQRSSPLNLRSAVVDHKIVWQDEPRRRVCIYGAGLGKDQAPLDDGDWEVWALNVVAPYDALGRLRCDRWWELHQYCAQSADDLRWIAQCPVPIYTTDDLLQVGPRTVRYPLTEIEARFGVYWACTFAYQIAMVLHEGVATDIGLFGVELCWGTPRERTVEWACVSYWLGRAEERGLRIHLPSMSRLARHGARYGVEYRREAAYTERYLAILGQRAMLETSDNIGG